MAESKAFLCVQSLGMMCELAPHFRTRRLFARLLALNRSSTSQKPVSCTLTSMAFVGMQLLSLPYNPTIIKNEGLR
jgi:hypothetical protein